MRQGFEMLDALFTLAHKNHPGGRKNDAYHPRCDVVNKMPRGRLCDFVSRRADCPLDCQPRTHARTRIPRRLTRQQQPHPTTTKSKDVEVD